jgi:dGTP triphosphohydrolase
MPPGFRARAATEGVRRSVADYIAGMTDRFLDRDCDRRLGG